MIRQKELKIPIYPRYLGISLVDEILLFISENKLKVYLTLD